MAKNLILATSFQGTEKTILADTNFSLQKGIEKMTSIIYTFPHEDSSCIAICKGQSIWRILPILARKCIAKIFGGFFATKQDAGILKKLIERQYKLRRFDTVICLADWRSIRLRALVNARLPNDVKRVYLFHELPVKNRGKGGNKERLDTSLIKRAYSKCDRLFYRKADERLLTGLLLDKGRLAEFPLVNIDDSDALEQKQRTCAKHLIYLGTFYKDIRSPEQLWSLLKSLPDYDLHVYGAPESFNPHMPNVFFHPRMPLSEIEPLLLSCTAFVAIHNHGTMVRGSKDVTYFSYGKPILSFGPWNPEYDNYGLALDCSMAASGSNTIETVKKWLEYQNDKTWDELRPFLRKYTGEYVAKIIKSELAAD